MKQSPPQIGAGAPFDVLGFVRRLIPFTHFPFRNAQRDGTGQQIIAVFGSPNSNTAFTLSLGRVPSEWVVMSQQQGGSVFAGTAQRALWTPTSITLQASAAGTYHIVVF